MSNYESLKEMPKAVEQLQQLGFGQYEAQAYVSLLQYSPLNGYELARASGIPRPNIYATLHKLEERGAVVCLESEEGKRYAPVASQELVDRLHAQFQDHLETARSALDEITTPLEHEHVWNARGYPALLEHAQALIEAAKKDLLVAVFPQEARALSGSLERAEKGGVGITTLCLAGCHKECGNCRGQVYRYRAIPEKISRWLLLIPDAAEILAGEIGHGGDALAVRTRQRLLVNLASWYIRQSIALSALLDDLKGQAEVALDPRTQNILEGIASGGTNLAWFDSLHQIIAQETQTASET